MMLGIIFLVLSLSLALSSGQLVQTGQCDPNIQLQEDFNATQFLGRWYVVRRSESRTYTLDCSYLELTQENNNLTVYNRGIDNNFLEETRGNASIQNGTAKFSFESSNPSASMDFWIIITDYNNLALGYACENLNTTHRSVLLWQLGRTTSFPTDMMEGLLNRTLDTLLGVTSDDLTSVDHSERACETLPVIADGQPVILPGQCDPNKSVVQNFNASRFMGVWHQISSYFSTNGQGTCNRAEYTLSGNVVNVLNSQVVNMTLGTISGNATVTSSDGSARLLVTLEITPGNLAQQPLWILATDYEGYAVSYTCVDLLNNERRVYAWIVSRSRQLSAAAQNAVNEVIRSDLDLNNRYFIPSNQTDAGCFFFPAPDPSKPVTFRGQCNPNITVVQNFDVANYLGIWHSIESYPSVFAPGTCNNANYTLGNNVVNVFNTQVINQTLDTMTGTAVVASTDGSAKLLVSFPVGNTNATVTTEYWVLATDYSSYALVYSCININDDEKQVFTWKLSRTKQLPSNGTTVINQIISTIPVLDQRYYKVDDQSPEGCFYYPEPQEGVPVRFPGQCEDINVTANFDRTRFQGTWYEIQAYPKEQQSGQCVSHNFQLFNNAFNLTSSSVIDQFASVSNGTATITSTDNSAKMLISITSNGQQIEIPYWILDTDYTNYALAYSCVNVNTDFRMVYSWKLSKTKELSNEHLALINNTIARVTVLEERYFEKIDQSADACLSLPEIPLGQPVILEGQCDPNIQVVQNFNLTGFLGRWRLVESYYQESQNGTCNQATYTLNADNSTVTVYNTQVLNQQLNTINGSARAASNDGSGKLLVTFPGTPTEADYWVLDTDYDSYALVYSCRNLTGNQRRIYSWKLSRTRDLSANATAEINRVINSIVVLNQRYYSRIEQTESACFYYPEVDGNPVVFRGQCNESIPVVNNFDAVAYMNTWYDVESYPERFQNGTCPTATYTLGATGVDVFNTQVVNQQLDTMTGVAVLTGPANIAKLNVTFPVAGTNLTTTSPYWVLSTDYTNYALVYSCVNIDEEYYRVSTWKLSRTRQLNAAANTAINNVINTVQELDNRYYINRNHTDGGCFYFPEPQPGVPVVFPGQCDQTIQAVPNFNMNAFQGTWYEIEAYPKDQQPGQCVSHQYSLNGTNILDLISSSVTNQIRNISNSRVTLASAQDSSGKLNITLTSGGSTITIPFWILSTDYNDYALAYSCVNRDQYSRAVYSWKLSKSKTLSVSGNNTINNKIAEIEVLDNKYYEKINQSDASCFYLPEINPGEPVLFDGQCNPNIPVVQNFNATAYAGRWRMIETYASDFQSPNATCSEATYTLSGGVVDVYNTQVVNQTLDVMIGNATLASTDGSAKLIVNFPNAPVPSDYWVLSTDYNSYALVYSCRNVSATQRRVFSWKLSRTRDLSANATAEINRVMSSIDVLDQRYYSSIEHSESACFYYPEVDGNPVTFRGQCNESIPVVNNFNAVAYMNTWYDIESYPERFQNGTCPTATYTLGATGVDVFNTQVVNQQLDTMTGVAVLTGPANIAKLNVTFPVAGTNLTTTSPYWVLSTDYTNYALVYSCINIGEEYYRVSTWKLSRTRQLNAAANTAINNVINTVQELDNRYYINRNHTDGGCFYFPEPQPGVPVVFPGQCDQTIQAVPNFNMNAFQGTWYEIEAYPKDQQPGQCVSHQYSLNGTNILDLISSSVTNQIRNISNSRVTLASAQDSSGKLSIILTSGGSTITIPFWILSTDYNDYALAYSCVNRDQYSRAVYSWKLSKSKTLSVSGNNTINNKIAEIEVLDNKYYEKINQSDASCFYLPEINPGEPVLFDGQCNPNIPVVQNFNATAYAGRWRMIETYASDFQSPNATCSEATYTLSGGVVDVYNTQVVNQTLDVMIGNATLASTDGSAKLIVNFPNAPVPSDYWVLSTDYNSYALVYSCRNVSATQRRVFSWKLSRTRDLSANATAEINRVMSSIDVLDQRYYSSIEHSESACFYYPEVDGNPVTFRGQCNESIPVVNNFNAVAYMNTWYDIESYPERFQNGTCPTATYTLGATGVDVFNTQVVNQQLDTMTGVAVLTGPANIAKLNVTFPVAGTNLTTTSPYWVLSTDYTNYALVYSCINIDEEYYRVSTWKLSRTRQLNAAANTAINNVINTVQELDNRYYINRNHTDGGCFYFPEPQPGVPVVFPGQCDQTIQAVPNFNMNAFQGTWYEIEAYPKDQQPGQCVSHQYSLNGTNILDLISSSVTNQIRNISNSRVTLASAQDSSGKLSIILTSGGSTITIPFWILSTDYNDYALAYSCVNRDQYSRAVYSWKLSKSKTLSVSGNNTINNKIAEIEVLDNKYYEKINQSDASCFYLPEINPGEPVLFDGQCNPNIPVVQNFNATAYAGRWRMIETYASDFQSPNATCSEATYTLSGGVVDVYNTQVVNQTLDVMIGNATLASTDGSAKLIVNFPNAPVPSDYWVLSTDYNSYALVYSCRNVSATQRRVFSWKLSRTRDLSANATAEINRVMSSIDVLDQRYYSSIEHSESACFYYPEVDGNPVTFRGQCNESIPVVNNFNAVAYMNTWYDIESYPERFQNGTCPTATYTLGATGVDVFNTQVVNQQLDTMTGVAVLTGPANIAKLNVTFPVAGTNLTTTSPYWVLSTDYTNYALVYSCVNIDEEYYRVSTWKLSRTRQLNAAANTAINNVINTVQELDNRYYINRNHTDGGCFYFPEPQPGVPVVFPGQCDQTIQAVPNFNMNAFQGTWYEIEAYPKDQQPGQCVSHQYSLNGTNILDLISSSVTNQIRNISNSRVTLASAQDSSGKLSIILTSGGSTITIPFWILSTDYNDYALAYSCVNRDQYSRAVYSWKLSKSKTLSSSGNNTINNKIAEIEVLDNKYYEKINQSDASCFYLPEINPGEPVLFDGQCNPNIPVVQNFNATAYTGRWRMIETYASDFQSPNATCSEATYTLSGGVVDVYNTQVVNQMLDVMIGNATLASTDGSAKLIVNFPNAPVPSDYWVLSTDYNSYALVYSCRNVSATQRRVFSWKLSRTRDLSANATAEINRVMSSIDVLDQRYYSSIEHSESACFYYPEVDGNPVTFRGQCNESIPVVNNFNAVAYMNTWYDIESYPERFQNGTCPTATYTLGATGVDVFNTQVVNQQLDTMTGVAVLTGPANIAKLNVTFPVAGTNLTTTSPYWVLSTDYTNYALVYSCINIDEEYYRVSTWKLSRTRQLNAAANTAINNVINTVQELDNRYYINRNHTDGGCFYFPEPQPGVPVVFPGQCDQTIQAVPNFNMNAFQGTWYEIEAYPKDQQPGQCVSHQYSLNGTNILDLISSSVTNQIRNISNSRVTLASAQDSSGKLSIILTSGGSTITIPFWILSTDYNDYALAYSCVNRDQYSRAVYSWKLSKSKTLSASGNNTINNKIAEIEVLDNKYYEKINQSDASCFYLPEINPGEPVLFDGQCNPNIPVVQNFNATAYAGRWRMIETYASDFQSPNATCSEATYTLSGGVVDVYNTQVVNQTLDVMIGNATLASTDGSAKLIVNFPNAPVPSDYWVLSTDYNSYALVYSCRNVSATQRRVFSWKLSRTRDLSANATAEINRVMSSIDVLDQRYYSSIEHSESACFYYPEVDGNPVTFRGQCNESIPVVNNFNAVAYMNTWYDIESYPERFQNGTCPTATYTLGATGVDVFNTQVVNQQLDTMNGVAVLTGPANIAKLNVTFPVAGTNLTTTSPYWVLGTDYTNYALVYSCMNINEEFYRISSWKLSRQKSLAPASAIAINTIMNSVKELEQKYFVTRGHTEENCFYYPKNNGGPVILEGQCESNVTVVNNFNPNSFSGSWYEISRFPSELQDGECVSSQFSVNNQEFLVNKKIVSEERMISLDGRASYATDGRGIINVNLTGQGVNFETTLYVMDVDYTDYALLYNCRNVNNTHKQVYSWKLSRSQERLSTQAERNIDLIVSSTRDLFQGYYEVTDQTTRGCFHYPVFDQLPSSIELIGSCDTTIRAKANFNVQLYQGKWYEIESYPQPFQFGECARAQYTLTGSFVTVLNSQVVNRTLAVQNATAVVASNDGSGLLNVTFVLPDGVTNTVNYYVLETDYTSFSLVYSCRDLPNGNRTVSSWKLSRFTTLSQQAISTINPIVANTEGLHQPYYRSTNQSDAACFYIPEVDKNRAPEFRGRCENDQPNRIQGFDAQRFLGWWHEIESYPSNNVRAECRSSEYKQVGNGFQVVDTSVSELSAQMNTSNVLISNNGQLRISRSDGQVDEIWVLATDYDNYALLYSCDNINGTHRRVWSAKYSKTRSLDENFQNQMATVIQNTTTLEEQFYLGVDQTPSACFYYPEPTGNPVILPGSCDQSIPVVQNFSAADYSGDWYQIERYPSVHENGTCVGARYTLNTETNVVDVLNWQVVNGVLDEVRGNATLNSTDGSAKLVVNLPVRFTDNPEPIMVSMELYVLATDYVSYSLAYSCVDVSPYRRAVGAWKLSRTRTMPQTGQNAINAVIESRQELNQDYFISVEQNDDCLEPSSAVLVKSSIIIMLICTILHLFK